MTAGGIEPTGMSNAVSGGTPTQIQSITLHGEVVEESYMTRVFVCALMLFTLGSCGYDKGSTVKSTKKTTSSNSPVLRHPIQSAAFFDLTNAWIVTGDRDLLLTHDGGVTWEKTAARSVNGFECVSFIDGEQGWTTNDLGVVWSTQDGGRTWRTISSIGHGGGFSIDQIKFEDEHNGWMLEPFSVWRTTDGGSSWTQKEYDTLLASACFVNRVAWVFDQDNRLFLFTPDGGDTSQVRYIPGKDGDGDLRGIYCLNENAGWITRGSGSPEFGNNRLYRTQDGGETWLTKEIPGSRTIIDAVYFRDDNEGWVAGSEKIPGPDRADGFTGLILHTRDGGQTWEEQRTGVQDLGYNTIYFSDARHGWLSGYDKVYRTDDGGKSWTVALSVQRLAETQRM